MMFLHMIELTSAAFNRYGLHGTTSGSIASRQRRYARPAVQKIKSRLFRSKLRG